MAVKTKSRPKVKGANPKTNVPREMRLSEATNKPGARVKNALPQKVLAYAARLGEPPAISDDLPETMPFVTDDQ